MQKDEELARVRGELAEAREHAAAMEQRAIRAEAAARLSASARRTLERLAANPDLDAFLGQVIAVAVETFGAASGGVWRATASGTARIVLMLEDGVIRTPHGADPVMRFAEQPLDAVFLPRRPGQILVNDVATTPEFAPAEPLREYLVERGIRTVLAVPMYHGDEFLGAMALRFREVHRLTEEEETLAHAFANQGALAMQLTRLHHGARAAAVTEERNRLAREIHDTIAQSLAAILRQLDSAARHAADPALRHIAVAREIARESLVEARRSIGALRPSSLDGASLHAAIEDLVRKSARISPAGIRLQTSGTAPAVPGPTEHELLRIANEALTNAMKHAKASTIDVELAFEGVSVRLRVRDDGVGFDTAVTGHGVGLHGMRERADRIGAALTVASEPGSGTEVLVYWSGRATQDGAS